MDGVKCIGTEFYGFTDLDEHHHGSSSVRTEPFPALRELSLKRMTSLQEWQEALHSSHSASRPFSRLQILKVENCPELTRLPDIEWLLQVSSSLEIAWSDKLTHLPEVLGRLEFLGDLEIAWITICTRGVNWRP